MLAGQQVRAGMGVATVIPDHDFETFSEAGFLWMPERHVEVPLGWVQRKGRWQVRPAATVVEPGYWTSLPRAAGNRKGLQIVGIAQYATHPSTEVLSYAYDLKDGRGPRWWHPGRPNPSELFYYLAAGGLLEAWNAAFEYWIWNHVCARRYGWPHLPARQVRCAMAKSRAHALPGKLEIAGEVLQLQHRKHADGERLLKKFSIPRNPTLSDKRVRVKPTYDSMGPDLADSLALANYNLGDIAAESEASIRTPDLSPDELEWWQCEQAINYRGVAIDLVALDNCIAIVEQAFEKYSAEITAITGGIKSSEVKQLLGWLHARGMHLDSLDEEAVEEALARLPPHPPEPIPQDPVRRVLEIRALTASASVKKLFAIKNQLSPWGRLHDLFTFCGARTGRETANGPQPHNLAKSGPAIRKCTHCGHHYAARLDDDCMWCGAQNAGKTEEWTPDAALEALSVIATRSLAEVERVYGDALATVSGCLRALFIAAPGHRLMGTDYSAIEGAVAAALSGCEWRLEVFRTHGKIYEMSASKISGVPFQEFLDYKEKNKRHHPLRNALGKFAELGSGFGGWIQAWKNFGADEYLSDDEIKNAILGWRNASPEIPEMWGGQERNWRPELYGLEGMAVAALLNPGHRYSYRGIHYEVHDGTLYCTLPSGRKITYHNARLEPHDDPKRKGLAISYEGWNTNPKAGAGGWVRMYVYGGKLFENVVQAVARDILVHAAINVTRAGYSIVLHVHDELVVEAPIGWGSLQHFESIVNILPHWARGWPVFARGGWEGREFRK